MGAKDLSAIKPQLDASDVRLIAIGVEELGVKEFVDGKFWAGELYIDQKKKSYKGLGFKSAGYLSTAGQLISKKMRDANKRAADLGITGNIKGDGLQYGGTIVVAQGGKLMYEYTQTDFADHVDPNEILKALDLKPLAENGASSEASGDSSPKKKVECNDDVCTIKSD